MTITVICEECGKKYNIPEEALDKLKSGSTTTNCRKCGHVITVTKPIQGLRSEVVVDAEEEIELNHMQNSDFEPHMSKSPVGHTASGLGLRSKMILLFLVIPLAIMSVSGVISQRRFNSLSAIVTHENMDAVKMLVETNVAAMVRASATQAAVYLKEHPDISREEFKNDRVLNSITVQSVGGSGFTALHEIPSTDDVWKTWTNKNTDIIGRDVQLMIRQLQREGYPDFWKIYSGIRDKSESNGYHKWRGPDGNINENYMVTVRIEDTPYFVTASVSFDAFLDKMNDLSSRVQQMASSTRNLNLATMVCTLIIIGLTVALFGIRLTGKIKYLTEISDKISVGDFDSQISITSSDEIGKLTESMARMQESLRLSIQRLRKKQ
jgi:nitrogen fixation/metabolism regulation signal transduction histidine kinase